jgi:hypothetical protein
LPTTMEVEAAKTSSSVFEKCMSNPRQGRSRTHPPNPSHPEADGSTRKVWDAQASQPQRPTHPRPVDVAVSPIGIRPTSPKDSSPKKMDSIIRMTG